MFYTETLHREFVCRKVLLDGPTIAWNLERKFFGRRRKIVSGSGTSSITPRGTKSSIRFSAILRTKPTVSEYFRYIRRMDGVAIENRLSFQF